MALLKSAAAAPKSADLPARAAFTSAVILMPLEGSLSSSSSCSASRRFTTFASLTSVTPANCSGVMTEAQAALPNAMPPTLKLTVSPSLQENSPLAPVAAFAAVPAT